MPIAVMALASLLAACGSGTTGMLPANPQTQSQSQAPSRVTGSAVNVMGTHAAVHAPNGSNVLVGVSPATGENPTGSLGRTHTDALTAPSNNPCPSGYSPGGTAYSPNGGAETVQCYPDSQPIYNPGPPQYGGGGGTPCYGLSCNSQPCYTGQGGPGCGSPCQPTSSCIAYSGKPKQGIHCDGAQFAVGDPVSPGNDNANNTAFFVNTEAGLWQNGQVVGYLYQGTYSANGTGQSFFGIQITNNASWNFGATIGINFGPIDVGVGGGYGVNDVSHVQWWNGKLPPGVNARNCWGSFPVQGT